MELLSDAELKELAHAKYGLFLKRRFLPIFLAQFLSAFNDNMLRNGLVVMIAYAAVNGTPLPFAQPAVLITLCSGLLVMPFMLFSSMAGQLADKCEKARLMTYTKVAEIAIMGVAFYGFMTHHIVLLMAMLFISGTHSTFIGPIKYSILPEHLQPKEMLAGTGFVAGGNYLAILLGLISGGLLVPLGGLVIGSALVAVAVAGLIASLMIPRTKAAAPETHVEWNIWKGSLSIVAFARQSKRVFSALMGLSWFLLVGSVFMAQFANYAALSLKADHIVYTVFLTIFSVGIALGAVLADILLKGEVSARYSPWALLGVSIFTFIMVALTPDGVAVPDDVPLSGVAEFFSQPIHWLLVSCMLAVAVCGGVYMVPLYALIQTETHTSVRSRVMAASNLFDSLFMTVAAVACMLLLSAGLDIPHLFLILAALNLLVFFYARTLLARHSTPAA